MGEGDGVEEAVVGCAGLGGEKVSKGDMEALGGEEVGDGGYGVWTTWEVKACVGLRRERGNGDIPCLRFATLWIDGYWVIGWSDVYEEMIKRWAASAGGNGRRDREVFNMDQCRWVIDEVLQKFWSFVCLRPATQPIRAKMHQPHVALGTRSAHDLTILIYHLYIPRVIGSKT